MKRIAALVLVGAGAAFGQMMPPPPVLNNAAHGVPTVPTPVYDVVSIKENKSGPGAMMWANRENTYEGTNLDLGMFLSAAYGVRQGLIFGLPKWAEEEHFDLKAKVTDADPAMMKKVTKEQREAMLAAVLEDRFGVKVHKETRQLAIYDLVVGKDGTRLKQTVAETAAEKQAREDAGPEKLTTTSTGPMPRGAMRFGPGMVDGSEMPVAQLKDILESQTDKKIVDQTGLTGKYDVHLRWAPEGTEETAEVPSLFTALEEQLGLKLKGDKGPVEVLVVDQVKQPTEN